MNKAALLDAIETGRAQWETLLDQVGEAWMTQPGVAGAWSVKDLIAHITWYEREIVGVLRARRLAGSDLWDLPVDQRNAAIFEAYRQRPLHDVRAEAQQVFQQLLESAQALAEEDLIDPHRFAEMPADWQPWELIAENSYDHYRQHISELRAWLETLNR